MKSLNTQGASNRKLSQSVSIEKETTKRFKPDRLGEKKPPAHSHAPADAGPSEAALVPVAADNASVYGASGRDAVGEGPQRDPFSRTRANQLAAEAGHSAQHLSLLAELAQAVPSLGTAKNWTQTKLAAVIHAVRNGAGQGRGDHYKPWIRIRRNFSSPVSHQVAESVGINARSHHLLSKLEFRAALLSAYLGVSHELREGLPMWPFEHPHPGADLSCTSVQPQSVQGLMDIAHDAGIAHGHYVGTKLPYIGTIDLMHTITIGGRQMLLGISCKPHSLIISSERNRERLELDRRYCISIGAHHVIEHGQGLDELLIKQLQDFKPLTSEIRKYRGTSQLADFAGHFDRVADSEPISDAARYAGACVGLDAGGSYLFFRLSIWLHMIDIDLSQPLQMNRPIKRGADRVLAALHQRYTGGTHD